MTLSDEDIRSLLAEKPARPAARRWPWVVSAVVVLAIGVTSVTSGGHVPLLSLVGFGIHEFGHLLFSWAPWWLTALAGSAAQVAFPLGLAFYFWLVRREPWATAPLLAWAGAALHNVALYIADAPYQRLELWGGEAVLHDWAQLLAGRAMQQAAALAWFAGAVGWGLVAAGLAVAVWPLVARAARGEAG